MVAVWASFPDYFLSAGDGVAASVDSVAGFSFFVPVPFFVDVDAPSVGGASALAGVGCGAGADCANAANESNEVSRAMRFMRCLSKRGNALDGVYVPRIQS